MRINYRLSLLLIFSLACLFMEPAQVAGQGWCGYGYNWLYPPSQADFEQHIWNNQAYRFLNYGDEGYYPYGVPAYNAPTYNTPANKTLTYNTPAYNQIVGNGNATSWLNEANVFYLTGSYEQAAESYAKAVNLDPSLSKGWLNLGSSLTSWADTRRH